MAFFCGTIKGYTFLNLLDDTIKNNPTASGLDLASGLVGRFMKYGQVTVFAPAVAKYSAKYLDLDNDKRLGVNYNANEHDLPDGKSNSFYPFVLQNKLGGIGDFVLYTKLPIELRGNILCRVMVRQQFEAIEVIGHDDDVRKFVVRGPPQPEILRISKGIRNDLIRNGLYREALRFGNTPGVYYSEMHDGVHLDSMVARMVAQKILPLAAIPCLTFANFSYPTYAHGIRNVHLDISSFDLAFDWVLRAVTQLKRLNQLHITGCIVDDNYNGDFPNRVHVTFGETKANLAKGSCLYPTFYYGNGDQAPGLAAIEAIRSLPTEEQEDRIYQLYLDIETIYRAMPKDAQWPEDCMFLVDFLPPRPTF